MNRFGCFQFAEGDTSRSDSFERSINDAVAEHGAGYIRDSLIVLPEAFNLKGPYVPRPGPYELEPNVNGRLQKLAIQFCTAFVVGLIEEMDTGMGLPYSSAYLITSNSPQLLSRKIGKDDMANGVGGDRLYQPCTEFCDFPKVHQDTSMAALICMDATAAKFPGGRHVALIESVRQLAARHAVICVPANMLRYDSEAIGREWSKTWPDVIFVLANGCSYGHYQSVLILPGRAPCAFQRGETVIRVQQIDH